MRQRQMPANGKEVKHIPVKQIGPSSAGPQITRLKTIDARIGTLTDVIEPDGAAVVLAHMEIVCPWCQLSHSEFVEVPKDLSKKLHGLMGKQVNISRLYDKHYAAEATQTATVSADLF